MRSTSLVLSIANFPQQHWQRTDLLASTLGNDLAKLPASIWGMAGIQSWKKYRMVQALAQRAVDLLVDKEVSLFVSMGIDLNSLVNTHRAGSRDLEMKQERGSKRKPHASSRQKRLAIGDNSGWTHTQQQNKILTVLREVHALAQKVRWKKIHWTNSKNEKVQI